MTYTNTYTNTNSKNNNKTTTSFAICLAIAAGITNVEAFAAKSTAFVPTRVAPISLEALHVQQVSASIASTIVDDEEGSNMLAGLFSSKTTSSNSNSNSNNKRRTSKPQEEVIESHASWMELLHGDEYDEQSITVVKFHASWCKSCQQFDPVWKGKVVRKYGDSSSSNQQPEQSNNKFKFASVDFGKNRVLCESMDINKLPTIQYYYQGQLLSSASGGSKNLSNYQQSLDMYSTSSPTELQFEVDLLARKQSFEVVMKEAIEAEATAAVAAADGSAAAATATGKPLKKKKSALKARLSAKLGI